MATSGPILIPSTDRPVGRVGRWFSVISGQRSHTAQFTRPYDPHNIQHAYTPRCIPQVHGAVLEAIAYMHWMLQIEFNSVTDNPLIFINVDTDQVEVLSGGYFHGEPLAIGLDYLGIAMTELGNISERRLMRLLDSASNGGVLPPFLIREGGLNSGFMLLQYTAAALATENKVLAHPASVDTIPTSANVEDHVSMGATAALMARQVNENIEHILLWSTAVLYSAIHFLARARIPHAEIGWDSGIALLGAAFSRFAAPSAFVDSFVTLLLVGLLLGLVRHRTGGIAAGIGLHMGWVWVIKATTSVTDIDAGARWSFLVGSFDGYTGWLVAGWAALLLVVAWGRGWLFPPAAGARR